MIKKLSTKYRKYIASGLFGLFYLQLILPVYARESDHFYYEDISGRAEKRHLPIKTVDHFTSNGFRKEKIVPPNNNSKFSSKQKTSELKFQAPNKLNIGGPSSPEASTFKAVGSSNLVNLFSGDFSYSIPLMDVGGYPVNLFYNSGISMEQEASWVGLGWNINPGTVSRNMRGVPDDFDGTDLLTQTQNVKPNRTWGGETGVDFEIYGAKIGFGSSIGFSYNNYLGPAMEYGTRISLSISSSESVKSEKAASSSVGLTASLGAKLNSRSGLTFSPSLSASGALTNQHVQAGVGLSTDYNSRSGISALNLHSELSYYSAKRSETDESKLARIGHEEIAAEYQTKTQTAGGSSLGSTNISFAKPSYTPFIRMPMENSNYSGQIEVGVGFEGFRIGFGLMGYYSESKVPLESRITTKPLVGYMYSEKANTNANAIMDMNRLNDAEVTPNTPIISAPQYTYDIFSIQGEGTGGSIRAYRGDLGFMRDNVTNSKEKNLSIGLDIGIPFHYGTNWNVIRTPTRSGGWEDGNNTLKQTLAFKTKQNNSSFENIYFKNPGEGSVVVEDNLSRIGNDNLVRFQLSGSNVTPRLNSRLEQFNKNTNSSLGLLPVSNSISVPAREKRTQVITMLNAEDASKVGLEKQIRNYTGTFNGSNNIEYDTISRVGSFRKKHHISEIDVLEQNGMRYVYGLPVYNLTQKDFTFSVENLPANVSDNIVTFSSAEPTINSQHMNNGSKIDGYVMCQETPAYASSFLLTGLLSPDYVDITGNGITEDDLGNAVKFNYKKSDSIHRWRTPRNNSTAATSHFNEGLKTEKKDNKATITYGEREAWYLNSIESKSMVAIFTTGSRSDGKGVKGPLDGRINTSENANRELTRIDLYTKAEIKAKGITNARPIKTVQFYYDNTQYALCKGSPDNVDGYGKLTLDSIKFSYNGQSRQRKELYVFNYGNKTSSTDNPDYAYNASDRWGTYKNKSSNPSSLVNADYPYTSNNKSSNDQYAAAWSLKKILLPSGGQMEIQYEADDYGYVQNRPACNMFSIYGLGNATSYTTGNQLYNSTNTAFDNYYVYVQLEQAIQSTTTQKIKEEIYAKYLTGQGQLAFKLNINMPKGIEPLTIYANYDDYGVCSNSSDKKTIYIKLRAVDGKSPLANSAIGFLTENIPGQAFPGYEVDANGLEAFLEMASGMLGGLKSAFRNVDTQMRLAAKGRDIVLAKSFIRLDNPYRMKYGGGLRVKKIMVKDNWTKMTGQYNSVYGQEYDYTTTEKIYGKDTVISSGVASYEPGIGSEENPFREIVAFSNKMPRASAQYGAIEMPMLEGFYPSPSVGYSKVTVRSIHRKGTHADSVLRSGIGKQVTEYYTAKDYPSYSAYTPMNNMEYHKNPFFSFFYKEILDRRTVSQGFLVETNDMHGQMKSQTAYSESDEKTPLSYSYYTYKNTGRNGLNDKVDFVHNEEGGVVRPGNMGVDMELMTDVREFRLYSNGFNGQVQVDILVYGPVVIPIPTFYPFITYLENKYRAVTCTKLINYHAIQDSVVVMDKGSVISTKTIAYDAETGAAIVTKTKNEFNDPVYTATYPAYWAYSGMGPAYQNIGRQFIGVNFQDGKILNAEIDSSLFESGDEVYITDTGSVPIGACAAALTSGPTVRLWVYETHKNNTALTITTGKENIFMDEKGKPFTRSGVSFRIIRSGKRNYLGLNVQSYASLKNPIKDVSGTNKLTCVGNDKVVSASAMEFKEKRQVDKDLIGLRNYYIIDTCLGTSGDSLSCGGIPEKSINPYLKGLIGNYKPYRSYVFYGERNEDATTVTQGTQLRRNGFIKDFNAYWAFNSSYALVPDTGIAKWVWNSELTKINSKSQELETRDALNRYTAAQYGFNKNMPVALIQNARYGQAFAEGFEDYGYKEAINTVPAAQCNTAYIDLSNITDPSNGSIKAMLINSDTTTIKAHSGKYMLGLDTGRTVEKTFTLLPSFIDSFNLNLVRDTLKDLNNAGGNVTKLSAIPSSAPTHDPTFTATNDIGMSLVFSPHNVIGEVIGSTVKYYLYYKTTQYTRITTAGTYSFDISTYQNVADTTPLDIFDRSQIDFTIKRLDGSAVATYSINSTNSPQTKNIYLPCGIYLIECTCSIDAQKTYNGNDGFHQLEAGFSYYSNTGTISYKSIIPGSICFYTKPIPATDSMMNASFVLQKSKKMLLSAWVREDCGNTSGTPCYKTTNDTLHISIDALGFLTSAGIGNLRRVGPLIEGWQKVEGDFTIPSTAVSAKLVLSNSGSSHKVYFDDIRIQPYNSNMKSYVYSPETLRLIAELDENNYAAFYEYDEEGQLIRVKKETIEGIKTIKETRSAKQKSITEIQ